MSEPLKRGPDRRLPPTHQGVIPEPESLVTRCTNCGFPAWYHREEPAYHGAEHLEPDVMSSVAERERDCTGWSPGEMTMAQARALKPPGSWSGRPSR